MKNIVSDEMLRGGTEGAREKERWVIGRAMDGGPSLGPCSVGGGPISPTHLSRSRGMLHAGSQRHFLGHMSLQGVGFQGI